MKTNQDLRRQLRNLIGMASALDGVLAEAEELEPLIRTSAGHELSQLTGRLESLADGVAHVATPSRRAAS